MTELEILRRRRELVLLSAQLQRETLVRRLDHVNQHPVQVVLGLATSAASIPILFKIGSMIVGRLLRKPPAPRVVKRGPFARFASMLKFLPMLKLLPARKFLPALKFLNRLPALKFLNR